MNRLAEGKRGGRSREIASLRLFFLNMGVSSAASFTTLAFSSLSTFLPSIISDSVLLPRSSAYLGISLNSLQQAIVINEKVGLCRLIRNFLNYFHVTNPLLVL